MTTAHAPLPPVGVPLLNPVVATSMVVLVANDHFAKGYFANAVTGKISDFAGLVFFPLVLTSVVELVARATGSRGYVATTRSVAVSVVSRRFGFEGELIRG